MSMWIGIPGLEPALPQARSARQDESRDALSEFAKQGGAGSVAHRRTDRVFRKGRAVQRQASIRNPADRVLRVRVRERIRFPDLTERRALKLTGVSHYTSRAHFDLWHRRVGGPDFHQRTGIFTPLVYVEIEVTDVPLDMRAVLAVRGESYLAQLPDAAGGVDRLVREGRHTLFLRRDGEDLVVGQAHLINMFTRYHPDPARRRVTSLPPEMGLGGIPSRITELPTLEMLVPNERPPEFADSETHAWHYGQTDPNGHVTGMEYLRNMECYIADVLRRQGQDLRRAYFSRARIVYRKPCFRGEGYRRVAWFRQEAPLVITGAFYKTDDPPDARPAVAIELTLSQHEG